MTAKEAVEKITSEGRGSFQVEIGSVFGSELSSTLRKKGWKPAKTYSSCSKATFETKLQDSDGKKVVSITSTFFMGYFTQVDFYPQTGSI